MASVAVLDGILFTALRQYISVKDAYCYKDGSFMVHTNQVQGGPTDGWYDFHKGILRIDDDALRVLYTFKPY